MKLSHLLPMLGLAVMLGGCAETISPSDDADVMDVAPDGGEELVQVDNRFYRWHDERQVWLVEERPIGWRPPVGTRVRPLAQVPTIPPRKPIARGPIVKPVTPVGIVKPKPAPTGNPTLAQGGGTSKPSNGRTTPANNGKPSAPSTPVATIRPPHQPVVKPVSPAARVIAPSPTAAPRTSVTRPTPSYTPAPRATVTRPTPSYSPAPSFTPAPRIAPVRHY